MNEWTEKQLENYTLTNMGYVTRTVFANGYMPDTQLLAQQVPCQYGIIDALVRVGNSLWLIEFKAEKAKQTVLGQLQRYRAAICNTNAYRFLDTMDELEVYGNAVEVMYEPELVVIAPDFSREVLMGATHCIKATGTAWPNDKGWNFDYTYQRNPASRGNNEALENALAPYLRHVIRFHKQYMVKEQDDIIVRSAGQQIRWTN